VLHHDGYGFVVPDSPIPQLDGDVFIPPEAIEDAMHGDHVLARIQRRAGGRSGAQRAEGRIMRILKRAHPSIVGLFRYGPNGNTVLPYDVRIQHEVEIPRGQELTPVFGRNWVSAAPMKPAFEEDASRAWMSLTEPW
jgi:ribonuclease R